MRHKTMNEHFGIPAGRSIKVFLPDGAANGLMVAEVMNWTGKALAAPRSKLADLLRREEANKTGVYILLGPDPDRSGGLKTYIGEGIVSGLACGCMMPTTKRISLTELRL